MNPIRIYLFRDTYYHDMTKRIAGPKDSAPSPADSGHRSFDTKTPLLDHSPLGAKLPNLDEINRVLAEHGIDTSKRPEPLPRLDKACRLNAIAKERYGPDERIEAAIYRIVGSASTMATLDHKTWMVEKLFSYFPAYSECSRFPSVSWTVLSALESLSDKLDGINDADSVSLKPVPVLHEEKLVSGTRSVAVGKRKVPTTRIGIGFPDTREEYTCRSELEFRSEFHPELVLKKRWGPKAILCGAAIALAIGYLPYLAGFPPPHRLILPSQYEELARDVASCGSPSSLQAILCGERIYRQGH